MRFGHFDDERREYVITRPDTPLPWINYLGSEDYFALVSNTAGGYSFFRDARLRRLIRYRYNNAPLDVGGRFLYLRDDDSGDVWNPGWQPTQRELDDYSCRHGLGYTVITGGARRHPCRDHYPRAARGDARGLADARDQRASRHRAGCRCSARWSSACGTPRTTPRTSSATCRPARSTSRTASIYHVTEYRERRDHFAWFASSGPVAGFETSREAFLGPYRGWDRPVAVETGAMAGSVAHGWQPIGGASRSELVLEPGESREVTFLLGYTENPRRGQVRSARLRPAGHARARAVIDRYSERGTGGRGARRPAATSGRTGSVPSRWTPATSTSTGWSTPGTPTSAW